jgi:hypothetical protein
MREKLSGLSIGNGASSVNFCLSFNVFSFGIEIYDGAFLIRLGCLVAWIER